METIKDLKYFQNLLALWIEQDNEMIRHSTNPTLKDKIAVINSNNKVSLVSSEKLFNFHDYELTARIDIYERKS
jgi:hypothetical protein